MRSYEYEKPPRASKEMLEVLGEQIVLPDNDSKRVYTAPVLDKPATTRLKSKDMFIERQRSKK